MFSYKDALEQSPEAAEERKQAAEKTKQADEKKAAAVVDKWAHVLRRLARKSKTARMMLLQKKAVASQTAAANNWASMMEKLVRLFLLPPSPGLPTYF